MDDVVAFEVHAVEVACLERADEHVALPLRECVSGVYEARHRRKRRQIDDGLLDVVEIEAPWTRPPPTSGVPCAAKRSPWQTAHCELKRGS